MGQIKLACHTSRFKRVLGQPIGRSNNEIRMTKELRQCQTRTSDGAGILKQRNDDERKIKKSPNGASSFELRHSWLFALRFRFSALLLKQRQILAVTFFFQLIHRNKAKRSRVNAKALPRRCRPVVENMAQVRVACF